MESSAIIVKKEWRKFLMKQRIQGIIIGVLLCATLLGGITLFARPTLEWRNVNVAFGNYRVFLDGVEFTARDDNGNHIELFNKDGWIFAPFEHIARAFGRTAYWDAETHSLYLGRRGRATAFTTTVPWHMRSNQNRVEMRSQVTMIGGNTFQNALVFSGRHGFLQSYSRHNLNGQYTRLFGHIGRVEGGQVRNGTFYFYGDGRLITSFTLQANDMPIEISVNIAGVRDLQVMVRHHGGTFGSDAYSTYAFSGFIE